MLPRMYEKRLKGDRVLGYELESDRPRLASVRWRRSTVASIVDGRSTENLRMQQGRPSGDEGQSPLQTNDLFTNDRVPSERWGSFQRPGPIQELSRTCERILQDARKLLKKLVALTGIERVLSQFGSVHLSLSRTRCVQFVRPNLAKTRHGRSDVVTRLSLAPLLRPSGSARPHGANWQEIRVDRPPTAPSYRRTNSRAAKRARKQARDAMGPSRHLTWLVPWQNPARLPGDLSEF